MAVENVYIDFVPDTTALDAALDKTADKAQKIQTDSDKAKTKSAGLSSTEQAILEKGNAELERRRKLLQDNLGSYAQELQATKAVNDAFAKQLASVKTVGDKIIVLGQAVDAAFQTGGVEAVDEVYKELQKTLIGTGLSVQEYVDQLKALDPETSAVAEVTETARVRLAALRQEMTALQVAGKGTSDEYKTMQTEALALSTAISNVNTDTRQVGQTSVTATAQLSQMREQLTQMALAGQQSSDEYKALQAEALNLQTTISQTNSGTKELTESTTTSTTQLRQMREELTQMAAAGDTTSEAYINLRNQAATLQNAVSNVNKEVKATSSDTAGIDNVIRGTSLLTAGFGAVAGAVAIFGVNSDSLQKTLVRVNGVMTVLNSLQAIQTELTRTDNVVTITRNALMSVWNALVVESTVFTKAWRTALVSTGIGALVIVLAIAVAKLAEFITTTNDATVAQDAFNESLQGLKDALAEADAALDHNMKMQLERAKQNGASEADLYKITADFSAKKISNQEKELEAASRQAADLKNTNSALYKSFGDDEKKRGAALAAAQKEVLESSKTLNDQLYKSDEATASERTRLVQERTVAEKKASDEAAKYAQRNNKAGFDLENDTQQQLSKNLKAIADDTANSYDMRLKYLQRYSDAAQNNIIFQREFELSSTDLTQKERLAIINKYNIQEEDIVQAAATERAALEKEAALKAANDTADIRLNGIAKQLTTVRKGSQQELDLQNEYIKEKAAKDIIGVNDSINNEKLRSAETIRINAEADAEVLKNQQNYQAQRLKMAVDFTKSNHDLQIAQNNASVATEDPSGDAAYKVAQQNRVILHNETLDEITALDKKFASGDLKDSQQYLTQRNELEAKSLDENVEMTRAAEQRKNAIRQAMTDAAIQIAQGLSDALFDIDKAQREAQLQTQLDNLDKQRQTELDNENLTEQQKADINARYDAKEKQLKQQAAEKDKNAAIAQALINAALSITKALTSVPFPFNIIAAATVGALAAVQVAKIKSTPTGFAKGTKNAPRGKYWVGEEGPELMDFKGGEVVYTAKESEALASSWIAPASPELLTNSRHALTMGAFDYDKLAGKVGEQVSKNSRKIEINTNLDRNGWDQHIRDGQSKTRYLNKRYGVKI